MHFYGYQLCSTSGRLVPLSVRDIFHIAASHEKRKGTSPILNFTFRYTDDILSLNNSKFGDYVDPIYLIKLEIKDTTETDRSASNHFSIDIHLEIDSEDIYIYIS